MEKESIFNKKDGKEQYESSMKAQNTMKRTIKTKK
jgi:hypothetical protein